MIIEAQLLIKFINNQHQTAIFTPLPNHSTNWIATTYDTTVDQRVSSPLIAEP